jgi:hypothetical protein
VANTIADRGANVLFELRIDENGLHIGVCGDKGDLACGSRRSDRRNRDTRRRCSANHLDIFDAIARYDPNPLARREAKSGLNRVGHAVDARDERGKRHRLLADHERDLARRARGRSANPVRKDDALGTAVPHTDGRHRLHSLLWSI